MQTLNSSISFFPIVFDASAQNWALLFYFVLFFSTGFAWRSWANYRATGINPLVLPSADNALGYIGRAFKIVMVLIFLYTVCAAFGWFHSFLSITKLWLVPMWLSVCTWFMLFASWIWLLLAQVHMGKSWRIGIDEQHATALVTHGLFTYSRNPIFLSMRCALFSLTLISPTAPILALTVAAELLMQIQVRIEEAHLTQLHGQHYLNYIQRVNRWL